jgi:integrase
MALFKKGRTWYIDYYVEGKRRREGVGNNLKVAQQVLAKRHVQVAEHRFLDVVKSPKISFEELSKIYMEYAEANKVSWSRDRQSIDRLMTTYGGKCISQITSLSLENYKSKRLKSVAPATVNRELACLKHMFTKAIQWQMATFNPVKQVRMLKEHNQRLRYLTNDEVQRLLAQLSPHIKPVVICALHTGMRRGEILNLKWDDVDLKQRLLFIRDSKNGEKREIPLCDALAGVIRDLPRGSDYVFCLGDGRRMLRAREGFETAVKRAGILNFTFHDLRHTFASHLAMSGVDLLTLKELLGHKSINMTLRYAHLNPDHKRKAVELLKYIDGHYLDTRESSRKTA